MQVRRQADMSMGLPWAEERGSRVVVRRRRRRGDSIFG